MTIFVQIASYRDPELIPTLRHCIERAKHPENLRFGICWQHEQEESIEEFKKDKRFLFLEVPYKKSKGTCWARHQAQKLYNDETFTLQLDSHHRFVQDWDEKIINLWKSLDDPKAIITGYPPNYVPRDPEEKWYKVPQICNVFKFNHKYILARPANMDNWESVDKPQKGVYISAGFIFGPGEINQTVPYDPDLYFSGEECALAIRYYTNGYNIYNSNRVIVYHYYQRLDSKKHWDDYKDWPQLNDKAHDRLDCLLGYEKGVDLGIYGIGKEKTLEEYEKYAGINFKTKIVHKDTQNGIEPPCSNSAEGWDNEIVTFEENLKWDSNLVEKCSDPRFWAFIILDQDDVAIHREDVIYKYDKDVLEGKVNVRKFIFDRLKNRQIPTRLLIWPYSESKQWLTPCYQPINIDTGLTKVKVYEEQSIKKFFNAAYYINLDDRTDRQEHMTNELKKHNLDDFVERYSAVKAQVKTPQECVKASGTSHRNIIQQAKDNNLDSVLIFEDDIFFKPDGIENIEKALTSLQKRSWDIFYFSCNLFDKNLKLIDTNLLSVDGCYCVHAYAVSKQAYDRVLKYNPETDPPIDAYLTINPFVKYSAYPLTTSQYDSISDNVGGSINYDNIFEEAYRRPITPYFIS
jgi:hypothetical protein